MTSPHHQLGGGGKIEVFKGAFHVPDFENPEYHDGSLVHYSHLVETAEDMGLPVRIGGRAFNQLYVNSVLAADQRGRQIGELYARGIDWRFNHRNLRHPDDATKRLRLFLSNELTADTFYDQLVPHSTDWPSLHLDVIEALLKSRGYDRESEKRVAQATFRQSLTEK